MGSRGVAINTICEFSYSKTDDMTQNHLQIAAVEFEITPEFGTETDNRTGAKACDIVGPLKTTVMLFQDDAVRLCLITTHFGPSTPVNVSDFFRRTIAKELNLPVSHVLFLSSHNHCSVAFAKNSVLMYESYSRDDIPAVELLPIGEQFLHALSSHAQKLPRQLQSVTAWWSEGSETRFTYNRKGRRTDGTTYLMREEDRAVLGDDFSGDIDSTAPVVVFKNHAGNTIAALVQFTGHPVTSYHPERTVVFGEWPQVACNILADHLRATGSGDVPVGFLQGCAGNVNSKHMLSGDVKRSTEYGRMLGDAYVEALGQLKRSERESLSFCVERIGIPLGPLPSRDVLVEELTEMDDFIQRAHDGHEETRQCVGLNFPEALSPAFRARMVELIRPWNVWALEQHDRKGDEKMETELQMDVSILQIGDVGIVAMPCEPFQEIGQQIRRDSPLPVTIPCGYANVSHGYIPDSSNVGDQEYMSSHHRYTRFRPPIQQPAGDVLAKAAVRVLRQQCEAQEANHES